MKSLFVDDPDRNAMYFLTTAKSKDFVNVKPGVENNEARTFIRPFVTNKQVRKLLRSIAKNLSRLVGLAAVVVAGTLVGVKITKVKCLKMLHEQNNISETKQISYLKNLETVAKETQKIKDLQQKIQNDRLIDNLKTKDLKISQLTSAIKELKEQINNLTTTERREVAETINSDL